MTTTKARKRSRPFSESVYGELLGAAREMCGRMAAIRRDECNLTHKDVLNLTVPEPHHDIILNGANVISNVRTEEWFVVNFLTSEGTARLGFKLLNTGNAPPPCTPLLPLYRSDAVEAFPEVHNKLSRFIDYLMEVTHEYTIVNQCIGILHDRCFSPEEARFMWPAIRTVAKSALTSDRPKSHIEKEELKAFLAATEDNNPPKFSAKITREEKQLFRMAAQYVTASLCLDRENDVDLETGSSSPYVAIRAFDLPATAIDGLGVERLNPYGM